MIDMIYFDTLKYVETLQASGVSEVQAKAFAKVQQTVLTECLDKVQPDELARKSDIVAVKSDIVAVKAELKADIAAVKKELKADIAELKSDNRRLGADVTILKADMRLLKWMMGFVLTGIMGIMLLIVERVL